MASRRIGPSSRSASRRSPLCPPRAFPRNYKTCATRSIMLGWRGSPSSTARVSLTRDLCHLDPPLLACLRSRSATRTSTRKCGSVWLTRSFSTFRSGMPDAATSALPLSMVASRPSSLTYALSLPPAASSTCVVVSAPSSTCAIPRIMLPRGTFPLSTSCWQNPRTAKSAICGVMALTCWTIFTGMLSPPSGCGVPWSSTVCAPTYSLRTAWRRTDPPLHPSLRTSPIG